MPRMMMTSVPVIASGPVLKAMISDRPMKVPGRDTGSIARKSMSVRPGNCLRMVRKARAMPKTVVMAAVDIEATQLLRIVADCTTPSMK